MRRLLSLIILFCGVSTAFAGDWPQWLGPGRNGVSDEKIAPWTTSPEAAWRRELGSGFSTPVVAEGTLFVHAQAGTENKEEVLALDAKTGEIRWREGYDRATYLSALGAGPRATPAYHAGRLYTFGITGVMTCFDGATGKQIWQTNPYTEFGTTLPTFGVCSSPIIVAGKIVVPLGGAGSAIVAIDAETGLVAWKAFDEPASSASPTVVSLSEGNSRTDVIVQTTLRVVGLNPEDGSIRWEHPLVFQPSGVSPTPLVAGDRLICTTQDTGTLSLKMLAESPAKPAELLWWKEDVTSYFSTGAVANDDRVYLVTNAVMPLPRADLRCLETATGKEVWSKQGLGYFHIGVIVTGDGKLLILDDAGKLTLAESTPDGYQQLSQVKVCGGTFVNPVLANGLFYARDGKEVVCVPLK